jgi:hypothetical protein
VQDEVYAHYEVNMHDEVCVHVEVYVHDEVNMHDGVCVHCT